MALKKKYYGKEENEIAEPIREILTRAEAMKQRRSRYENMWRNNIYAFVAFAVYGDEPQRQFDPDTTPELQAYYNDRFSSGGFKFTDTRYPLEFAVILRKMAQEMPNLARPDWKINGEEDQSPALLWKAVYDEIMYEAESDFEDFETYLGKDVFGTAFTWSRMEEYKSTIRVANEDPESEEKWVESNESKTIKRFTYSAMDVRNVLIDDGCKKTSLRDCEDAIVFEYLGEGRAKQIYHDVYFEGLGIKPTLPNMAFQDFDTLFGGDNKQMYEVMHYYNLCKDSHYTIINGVEVRESPIPTKTRRGEKKIPLAMFVDHKIPGSPYGIGECTITKAFREIKNKNRNLIYDVTKKGAKPTIAVDPLSPFNEETYVWGSDFLRIAPNDMQPIPVNVNLDPALNLDERTDNDVTIATGVNISDTSQAPSSEKATKTVIRKESQVAVVELGLTFNTNVGFRRLHTINADIIRLHLLSPDFGGKLSVTTENRQLFRSQNPKNGKMVEEPKKGNYLFKYTHEDVNYEFMPILIAGNLAVSKELKKGVIREDIALLAQIAPDALDPIGVATVLMEDGQLPKQILRQPENEQPDQNDPDAIAQKYGALVPEEIEKANQFKNAQKAKGMEQSAQGNAPVGAVPAPAGQPVA